MSIRESEALEVFGNDDEFREQKSAKTFDSYLERTILIHTYIGDGDEELFNKMFYILELNCNS